MAFENLFVRTKKLIGGIQLDGVITENHDSSIRITRNPVELGADTTDNAVIEPKRIVIEAIVTDTPIGVAALGEIVDTVTGLFGTATSENTTRSVAAYNALIQLQELREPIEVQTKLKLYENMLITNIKVKQDKDTSRSVMLVISMEEIIIVSSQLIQLEESQLGDDKTKSQGTSPENKGKVSPTTPKAATQKSVLKSVIDWVGS